MTMNCVFWVKETKLYKKISCTEIPTYCQLTTKPTSKRDITSFGPVCQFWSVNLNCRRDSKPQRDVQQQKLLKLTWFATNRDKPIHKASKQTFANNLLKMSFNYTKRILFNWKICFKVINKRTYVKLLGNLNKSNDTVM